MATRSIDVRLFALAACCAWTFADPVHAQSPADEDRRIAQIADELRKDPRPMAQLGGMLLMREEKEQDAVATRLSERADVPGGVLALLAMKTCLEHGYLAPPEFCNTRRFLGALSGVDPSNEFSQSLACRIASRRRELGDSEAARSEEATCARLNTSTQFDDYSQTLKTILIEVFEKHDFPGNSNFSPYGEIPVMHVLPPSMLFAEMVVVHAYDDLDNAVSCSASGLSYSIHDAERLKALHASLQTSARRMLANGKNSLPTVQCAERILADLKDPQAMHRQEVLSKGNHGNYVIHSKDAQTIAELARVITTAAREGDAKAWPEFINLLERDLAKAADSKAKDAGTNGGSP